MNAATGSYKRIGIVGGLGPLASANFYAHLAGITPAGSDQEHPYVVLISDPALPSRLAHLSGSGPSPLPGLVRVAQQLVDGGAEVIALPSVTTHAYYDAIVEAVPTAAVVDILDAAGQAVSSSGATRIAMAMTSPARTVGLLEKRLAEFGVSCVLPPAAEQQAVQEVVDGVKAGQSLPGLAARLESVFAGDWAASADACMIGCTDISPIAPYLDRRPFDVAHVYAEAVIRAARVEA